MHLYIKYFNTMERYEIMWEITQCFGYKYDLRKIENQPRRSLCIIGCPIHGWIIDKLENYLKTKRKGCTLCSFEKRYLTWEKFIKRAKEMYGDNFTFYEPENKKLNNLTKIKYECNHCHYIHEVSVNYILSNKLKQTCCSYSPYNKLSLEEVKRRINEAHNSFYGTDKIVYISNSTPIILTCPKHGDFSILPLNAFKGVGCKKCAIEKQSLNRTKSHEQYVSECGQVHGKGRYIYLTEYKGEKHDITFQCTKCGRITTKNAERHLKGVGCSFCSSSKLEREVRVMLENNNINFTPQYSVKRQSLDFYLDYYNIGIECQGSQHFKNKFIFKQKTIKEYKLDETIKRDIRKYNYCKDNDIKLIYYTESNLLKPELINNEKFGNIYQPDNIFSNLDDLLTYINNSINK